MTRPPAILPAAIACALAATLGPACAPAHASATTQAQDSRGGQNGRDDSQPTRDELRQRIAELEAERDLLRRRLAQAVEMLRNLGADPPPTLAPEPVDPLASPANALHALRRRATIELANLPRRTEEDRQRYERLARQWIEKATEGLTGERQWLVRTLGVTMPTSGAAGARALVRLQPVDAATGLPLALPMEAALRPRDARRMADEDAPDAWLATVRLRPQLRYNPDRADPGPFDYPPLLAPHVEGVIDVQWLDFNKADVPPGFFDNDPEDPDNPRAPRLPSPPPAATPEDGQDSTRQPR